MKLLLPRPYLREIRENFQGLSEILIKPKLGRKVQGSLLVATSYCDCEWFFLRNVFWNQKDYISTKTMDNMISLILFKF